MTLAETPLMTTEQLLAMPDDGTLRELIRGRLREEQVTRRNYLHSTVNAQVPHLLLTWLEKQTEPRGRVVVGEAGFRLRRNPDTTVGIDVAYISAETAKANPRTARLIEGVPVLAIEILWPSDTQEDILDKVQEYLDCGVKIVWLVEPIMRTITVYRPDSPPAIFHVGQNITAEPHLPGFKAALAEILVD
jgi:Uma2 family endonuclease